MSRIAVNRGFTLIELLVTIAIAAILLRLAVPGMQSIMENSAVNKHVTTFMSDLRYARSEAIKAGMPVVMCRSANSEAASPSCTSASGGWESGWLIYVDRDSDNSYSSGDTIMRIQGSFADSGGITWTSGPAVNYFSFISTGMLKAGNSSFTFNSKSLDGTKQKLVCISRQGRARVLKDSFSSCTSADS